MRYAPQNLLSMAAYASAGGRASTRPMGVSPAETTTWSNSPTVAANFSTSSSERMSRVCPFPVTRRRRTR